MPENVDFSSLNAFKRSRENTDFSMFLKGFKFCYFLSTHYKCVFNLFNSFICVRCMCAHHVCMYTGQLLVPLASGYFKHICIVYIVLFHNCWRFENKMMIKSGILCSVE